jgi:ParB/RepB/Spo0J family partition protein
VARSVKGQVGRGDQFKLDPEQVLADDGDNGRFAYDGIPELARSIVENGQIEPVLCQHLSDGRVRVKAGFRRHRAVLLLWHKPEDFGLTKETRPPLLAVVRSFRSDDEAFEAQLAENRKAGLSPMDLAVQYRNLIERAGWLQTRVADRCGVSGPKISRTLKLLTLPVRIQQAVHTGGIKPSFALKVAKLVDHVRLEQSVEGVADDKRLRQTLTRLTSNGKSESARKPTLAKLREVLAGAAPVDPETGTPTQLLVKALLDYLAGDLADDDLLDWFGARRPEPEEATAPAPKRSGRKGA